MEDGEFLRVYNRMLRQAKQDDVDLTLAPPEVQEAALALHQHATAIIWKRRQAAREAKRAARRQKATVQVGRA